MQWFPHPDNSSVWILWANGKWSGEVSQIPTDGVWDWYATPASTYHDTKEGAQRSAELYAMAAT